MSAGFAAFAVAAAVVLLAPRRSRLDRATGPRAAAPQRRARAAGARSVAAVMAALAVALLVGGVAGLVGGFGVAVGLHKALPAPAPAYGQVHRDRDRVGALPLALDVLAACVSSGVGLLAALDTAARAVGGPLGADLDTVRLARRLGVDPGAAWLPLLGVAEPPPLRQAAAAMARAEQLGAPLTATLVALADDARSAARQRGEAAARRAGVLTVGPLGLCFLPAFVLLAVVPIVAGLLTTLR